MHRNRRGSALWVLHTAPTRDIDLFLHGRSSLGDALRQVEDHLADRSLPTERLQTSHSFARLLVRSGTERVTVDLVAEPVPFAEHPTRLPSGIQIDTAHEILVNKLGALLSRSELRDLEDVRVLLVAGGQLSRALEDAAKKDGGFSPLTLAWTLQQLPLARAASLGFDESRLERARDQLVQHLSTEKSRTVG